MWPGGTGEGWRMGALCQLHGSAHRRPREMAQQEQEGQVSLLAREVPVAEGWCFSEVLRILSRGVKGRAS